MDSEGTQRLAENLTVPAEYFTLNQILCFLPSDESYLVDVSNDGTHPAGSPQLFVPHDPVCHDCRFSEEEDVFCVRRVCKQYVFWNLNLLWNFKIPDKNFTNYFPMQIADKRKLFDWRLLFCWRGERSWKFLQYLQARKIIFWMEWVRSGSIISLVKKNIYCNMNELYTIPPSTFWRYNLSSQCLSIWIIILFQALIVRHSFTSWQQLL